MKDGQVRVARGKVAPAFLSACEDVVKDQGIANGTIEGIASGKDISLRFSRSIPRGARQRLRNVWALHR